MAPAFSAEGWLAMPEIAQVRKIIFNDEEIGMGFNSQSGLAVGTALEGFEIPESPLGQTVSSHIEIVHSHDKLMSSLGMSFEAQGRYGFFSASAKASFAESSSYNSNSTFLVASVVVQNPLTRGRGFRVIEHPAKDLLDAMHFDDFTKAFGDSFVRGLQTGGEFYAVIRITSVSTETQSALAASLQAEANGLVASGSFKLEFNKSNSSASTRSEYTATMYQKAGTGAQIAPTVTIDEVLKRFKEFPAIAKKSPGSYETEVVTYDTIPLPVPTPEEQEAFVSALADARTKKLYYLQTRNDLEFARQNPEFFDDLPPAAALTDAASDYTQLINAVTRHAIELSRGHLDPPTFFDPSVLSPPLAEPDQIDLKRKVPDLIDVVSLVGLRGHTIAKVREVPNRTYAQFITWATSGSGDSYEPETRGVIPSADQYRFIQSGADLIGGNLGGGVAGFWSWIYEQDPSSGRIGPGADVQLTTRIVGAGHMPDDLKHLWGPDGVHI
jgi:hypothetical protein